MTAVWNLKLKPSRAEIMLDNVCCNRSLIEGCLQRASFVKYSVSAGYRKDRTDCGTTVNRGLYIVDKYYWYRFPFLFMFAIFAIMIKNHILGRSGLAKTKGTPYKNV